MANSVDPDRDSSCTSLNLDTFIVANRDLSQKSNRIANKVDPDERARYKPSHLDLYCLQRYLYWSVGMKGLWYYFRYKTFFQAMK